MTPDNTGTHVHVNYAARFALRLLLALSMVGLFIAIILLLEQSDALAAIAFAITVMIAIAILWNRLGLVSWTVGIPAFYGVMFLVLPLATNMEFEGVAIAPGRLGIALLDAATGIAAFTVAVLLARLFWPPRERAGVAGRPELRIFHSPVYVGILMAVGSFALVWSYFYGYFGLVSAADRQPGSLAGFFSSITFFLTIAHVIAWNRFFVHSDRRFLLLGSLSTAIMFATALVGNSKGNLVMPFFLIGLVYWGARRQIPARLFIAMAILYGAFVYPMITTFRQNAPSVTESRTEFAQRALESVTSASWARDNVESGSVLESLGRGLFNYFTTITTEAGRTTTFLEGETFSMALSAFMPRFLFPDKVDQSMGNYTATLFDMLDPGDERTNLSPSLMGELYMNFGLWGIIIGMFVMGVIAVFVDAFIIGNRLSWAMPVMGSAILWQESMVGQSFLPFLKTVVLLWLFVLALNVWAGARRRRRGGLQSSGVARSFERQSQSIDPAT